MQAEKLMLETDEEGNLLGVPKLPPRARLEAIFLILEEAPPPGKRQPPPELRGSVTWVGDPVEPTIPEDDWEASLQRSEGQVFGDPQAFK